MAVEDFDAKICFLVQVAVIVIYSHYCLLLLD